MRLNDIWRNVNQEIGFYVRGTFDKVPRLPGIYAWFYPLRVTTKDPFAFINEVNTILNYDAFVEDKPYINTSNELSWERFLINFKREYKEPNLDNFMNIWNTAINSESTYNHLRRIIMKASIFMPPLYVGKTVNLFNRCSQHRNGNDINNNFSKRYSDFTNKHNLKNNKVSDLLFVTISTKEELEFDDYIEDTESLVEEILKHLSKPAYSKR